ncbi:MAG: ABC transporter ATP-binding protein [Burkholderiaceae bacterium]|nr:ABC transporter ATP-binding protein [Burkholderiaceae bacterium]
MVALELQDVRRHFGGVKAVDGVSFQVPAGKVTGLIGPNGSGKSTLVNLIAGVLGLTSGEVRLHGEAISTEPADAVARRGVARTFQNIRLLPEASVLDNVVIGFYRLEKSSLLASLLGLPSSRRESRELRERGRALLARFDMSSYEHVPAGGLAYGFQRRVEMMRAVASDPAVLLLDEPVAGMNDVEASALGNIFARLAEEGMAVLVIEHNTRFVSELCEQVHVLDSGRLIANGTPQEVMRDPAVIAAYLGD